MSGCKCNLSLIVVLALLLSGQAFAQQVYYPDSLARDNSQTFNFKPNISYSIGSTFMAIPRVGSLAGFTFSPSISLPLSQNLSVNGGIIAGRYYSSFGNSSIEGAKSLSFNDISVYGSAVYRVNPQLTLYGTGIKRLTNTSPFHSLPESSYTIGSNYNFGSFSIGLSVQMSKWNNNFNSLPINGSPGFYSPFQQNSGPWY